MHFKMTPSTVQADIVSATNFEEAVSLQVFECRFLLAESAVVLAIYLEVLEELLVQVYLIQALIMKNHWKHLLRTFLYGRPRRRRQVDARCD